MHQQRSGGCGNAGDSESPVKRKFEIFLKIVRIFFFQVYIIKWKHCNFIDK